MAYTNTAKFKFISDIPLDSTYNNTRFFSGQGAQYSYFDSQSVYRDFSGLSYQRVMNEVKTNTGFYPRPKFTVKVNARYEEMSVYNYLYFTTSNEAIGYNADKRYFCFINSVNYISPECCEIEYELDVLQTYLFDITIKDSFVVREHSETDLPGENINPEPAVDTGEYFVDTNNGAAIDYNFSQLDSLGFILATAILPDSPPNPPNTIATAPPQPHFYGQRIIDGVIYTMCDNVTTLNNILSTMALNGHIEAVMGLFSFPKAVFNLFINGGSVSDSNGVLRLQGTSLAKPYSGVSGYVPKNKKLYTYPYKYLYCPAANKVYRYEFFNDNVRFSATGIINIDAELSIAPLNYKFSEFINNGNTQNIGTTENYDEGFVVNYPQGFYGVDNTGNWYALNKNSIAQNRNAAAVQTILGVAGLAMSTTPIGALMGLTAIVSGVNKELSAQAQLKDNATKPTTLGGRQSSHVELSTGQTVKFIPYAIRPDYAKKIDEYFSLYGYSLNNVKTPNLRSRPSWNYIQLRDPSIQGKIPTQYLNHIKQIFSNGIRLWHVNDIGNYSLANEV